MWHQLLLPSHSNWERFHQSLTIKATSLSLNIHTYSSIMLCVMCGSVYLYMYIVHIQFSILSMNLNTLIHSKLHRNQSFHYSCLLFNVFPLSVICFSRCPTCQLPDARERCHPGWSAQLSLSPACTNISQLLRDFSQAPVPPSGQAQLYLGSALTPGASSIQNPHSEIEI